MYYIIFLINLSNILFFEITYFNIDLMPFSKLFSNQNTKSPTRPFLVLQGPLLFLHKGY